MSVRPSVCLLDLVGQVQGSVSLTPNNYFDVFAVTHVKHKEIFLMGNVAQVALRRILFVISGVYYFGDQNRGIPRATASIHII